MSEWWTYRLSDFLMFAPRTYYRLFERYNAEVWPAQAVALAIGVVIGLLVFKSARPDAPGRVAPTSALRGLAIGEEPGSVPGKAPSAATGETPSAAPLADGRTDALALRAWALPAVCALLAGCWLWVAVMFHLRRYAEINWAANWFGAAFALQAGLLLLVAGAAGLRRGATGHVGVPPGGAARGRRWPGGRRRVGLGLLLFALVVQPCVGVGFGRPWQQAEVFGLAPDPTAVATLGLLLLMGPGGPPGARRADTVLVWMLWPVPMLWCLASGATLWAMQAPDAWLMPAAALLAGGAAWRSGASG